MSKYHDKYLLYKNKYILLKNQYGSAISVMSECKDYLSENSSVLSPAFYLPCEITHITTKIYCDDKIKEKFGEIKYIETKIYCDNGINHQFSKIGTSLYPYSISNYEIDVGYKQDPFIQLYDGTEDYYNIYNNYLVKPTDLIKKESVRLTKKESVGLNKKECDFKHIYKHIYEELEGDLFKYLELDLTNKIGYETPVGEQTNKIGEQTKGGNFISGPKQITIEEKVGYPIFYISGIAEELKTLLNNSKSHLIELECSFKASGFRHIDELMCFMPYGKEYKIWFYDELNSDSIKMKNGENAGNDNLITIFNDERIENLNKICKSLFNEEYNEVIGTKNFVFFKFFNYYPSILNRSWIETLDNCYCIYPEKKKTAPIIVSFEAMVEYTKSYDKFFYEMGLVNSYINPGKNIILIPLEVKDSNIERPEGGPHCLIKQRFSLPRTALQATPAALPATPAALQATPTRRRKSLASIGAEGTTP